MFPPRLCEPHPHLIPEPRSVQAPRQCVRAHVLGIALLPTALFQLLSQACRGGDSPRFNLDLQDTLKHPEHPLVSLFYFLCHGSFLGPWIRIRCWRRNLPQFLQVHNSYLIYRLHFDSQVCLTQVHEVSLLCCLWKALHFKKCKSCATFCMSVCYRFDLNSAWVELSCWFALVEVGAWCFQHRWLKRQPFLHWLPPCLCQNSVDCPRVGLGLLWTCPPAHCPRGSASTDRPTWPQSQGPWSESGRPW